jgi:phosphoglucomutase
MHSASLTSPITGTAGSGATIRMYLEKYEPVEGRLSERTSEVLQEIVAIALDVSQIPQLTGMQGPTVIT